MLFSSAHTSLLASGYDAFVEYIGELHALTIFLRLFLATVCAGILGFERQRKSRPAGLRTHIVVCIGAALVMMINQSLLERGIATDAARLGAQVISGIGFLGAGTIIVTGRSGKTQVKGLTTAASLWTCACMGLAIGCGFYLGAIITCFFVVFAMTVLNRIDIHLYSHARALTLHLELSSAAVLSEVCELLNEKQVEIRDLKVSRRSDEDARISVATLELRLKRGEVKCKNELLLGVSAIPGVLSMEEL
jgi:putative Mg2+ transporter-C (MgtC) family protein